MQSAENSDRPLQPEAVYREHRDDRRSRADDEELVQNRIATLRLFVFVVGGVLAWFAFYADRISGFWIFVPLVLFIGLMRWHEQVIRRQRRAERAAEFYHRGLERLSDEWAGRGLTGDEFLDPHHPYAADLDIFGRGSLFDLICRARTKPGERTLAIWLREPASADEIRRRQLAIDELRPRLGLREDLAVLGEEIGHGVDPDELLQWAEEPPVLKSIWLPLVAGILGVSNVVTLIIWISSGLDLLVPFAFSALASAVFLTVVRRPVETVLARIDGPERELKLLAGILERLEAERFKTPKLQELEQELGAEHRRPSENIASLARTVEFQRSFFQPLALLLIATPQLAWIMERWRSRNGKRLPHWIAVLGQMEALCSLSGQAYEHPNDIFPEVVEGQALLEGEGVAHPLLPESRAVRNGIRLGDGLQLLLVSGSNMSGKSTFLRTIGMNAALALAGGTVRATAFRLSPLTIGACMRVQDSLQQGLSHFYAEIKRLRRLVDLVDDERPLLFLLDEILHGTNSHDRRVGAEALIRDLVERGSLGLVTTHDLALAGISERLEGGAVNVHFQDHLEGDRIVFDYKLRDGVLEKSNALGLMRAIGLKV